MVKSYEKFDSVSSVNNFVSKGKFQQKSGSFKLGTGKDNNHSLSLGNGKVVFNVGSAYTQGNQIRSLFNLNDNGTFLYQPTTLDKQNVKNLWNSIFLTYPNLQNLEFLYPIANTWNAENTIAQSKDYPLYRFNGKGLGKIEFYNTGSTITGNLKEATFIPLEHYSGWLTRGKIPPLSAPRNINGPTFPYCGMIYSGTLLQYNFEKQNNFKNIKVIPYQAGRGIPQWDPTKEYFGGAPFGVPKIGEVTIEPQLSHGVGTTNNDYSVGVALDTQSDNVPKIYNYEQPPNAPSTHEPWYNHPAPFTAPPEDISFTKTNRVYSPGPNLSGCYWAPWPNYYAYKDNEPIPVLTQGKVTVKIGAACNIGMQAYYEPDVVPGDNPINNPNYVSVSCVPLFQGEKIKVGSDVFASAMGQVITWDTRGVSPYPAASYVNCSGNKVELVLFGKKTTFRDSREENPWYDYRDSTFGAIGWTSTPAFLLSSLPDQGKAVIESKVTDLPYMVQSCQGSVIVQGSTTIDPLSTEGSGRMELLGPARYSKPEPGQTCTNFKFEKIKRYPATPGRTQTCGMTMQEIEGKGKWNYTGTLNFTTQDFNVCGYGYQTGIYYTRGGTGVGCLVEVTNVDINGSITGINTKFAGTGYTDGDVLTLIDPLEQYGKGSLQLKNTATVQWIAGVVSLHYEGTGYESEYNVIGYNLSRNNLIMKITTTYEYVGTYSDNGPGVITDFSVHSFVDASEYPVGTTFYAMNTDSSEKYTKSGPLAIFVVTFNDGVTIQVQLFSNYFWGDNVAYRIGTYLYSTLKIDTRGPAMTIKAENGNIKEIKYTDTGIGNLDQDIILVQEGEQNCIIRYNSSMHGLQLGCRMVEGGSGYVFNQKTSSTWITTKNNVKVLNPGRIYSGIDMYITNTSENGTINKISYNNSDRNQMNPLQPDFSSYTGTFGSIQTLEQTVVPEVSTQPVAGPEPVGGWPSFVNVSNATFEQDIDFKIIVPGTGYSIGGSYTTTGGSGNGLTVIITEVDYQGKIIDLRIKEKGALYKHNDVVSIAGGGGEIVLKIPKTQRVRYFGSIFSSNLYGYPMIFYDFDVLVPGTGYVVGGPYNTVCNNRFGEGLKINILKVDTNGGIQDIEILELVDSSTSSPSNYLTNYNIVIESGNNDAVIQLKDPVKTKPINFTKQGTNYVTATGVSTYNITQNSLYTICGLETMGAGQCEVISYGSSDTKPPGWNFKRYNIGDIISFNQLGNKTATAEIISLNPLTQEITFNQLTTGVGYTQPATPYGFLPTLNLTKSATTVDIVAENGFVKSVSVNTLGVGVEAGDYLLIEQGDYNCVVQVQPLRDVPPEWQIHTNGTPATFQQWNDYKEVMKSAVNLLDYPLFIDMMGNYPNYMNVSYYSYGDEGITNEFNCGFIEQ